MPKVIPSPLKYPGGKSYLATKIVKLFPPHLHRVEPYFGGGSVTLASDPEGVSEVVNDVNGDLMNFWEVLQGEENFSRFVRLCQATPFSEGQWQGEGHFMEHFSHLQYPVEHAHSFFIRARQSLAGRMDSFTGITRTRVRRGMNAEVSAWLTAVEGLPAVHARLKRALILNRPALEVIRSEDTKDTLFYIDPPYMHETRKSTTEYGPNEMSEWDHQQLLETLAETAVFKGKFLLSGYRSKLYDEFADFCGWHRTDFDIANHAAGGDTKQRMIESVWSNFLPGE